MKNNCSEMFNKVKSLYPRMIFQWGRTNDFWYIEDFFFDADRYAFDEKLLSLGFWQIDSEQDAWYYGTWININSWVLVNYAEWDVTLKQLFPDKVEDYIKYIFDKWYCTWIDAWLDEDDLKKLEVLLQKINVQNYK